MQNYVVNLQSEVFKTFRCQKAADSLDIDTEKKSIHHLQITADLKSPFNVGLILGASGSGKTTLAKQIFGEDCFHIDIDPSKPIIDQFPQDWSYDECAATLSGIGLTSVPTWIRPVYTMSNGQRARAEAALSMSNLDKEIICIDEWTSVVDRTVAKVMSHCVQKHARRSKKKIVLNSCHYDVIEWLNPDWIIDCNKQTYENRRSMVGTFERTDRLRFGVRETTSKEWKFFQKFHYLSEKLPGGRVYYYGLFQDEIQVGFVCYAAYIPGNQKTFFFNRLVIHPDYCGLGLGLPFVNATAEHMVMRGFEVRSTFSSTPTYKLLKKDPRWICTDIKKPITQGKFGKTLKGSASRGKSLRHKVTLYSFKFIAH